MDTHARLGDFAAWIMLITLGVTQPACGADAKQSDTGAGEPAAGVREAGDSGSKRDSETQVEGEAARVEPAGDEAVGDPCKVLVERTREVCAAHLGGAPDAGCLLAIKGIEMAAKQAGGELFDVGEDNAAAAAAACRTHLSSLQAKAKDLDGAEPTKWGPECTKLVDHVTKTCLEQLGTPAGPDGCHQFAAMGAILDVDPNKDNELGCAMLLRQRQR